MENVYKTFDDFDTYKAHMEFLNSRIDEWNAKRGMVVFNKNFEVSLFVEECIEFLKAETLAESFCELADIYFVLTGSSFKSKVRGDLDDIDIVRDMAKLLINFINLFKNDTDMEGTLFSSVFYNVLEAIIANNELKPFEKDERGKVIKGEDRNEPVEMVTPIFEHFNLDPNTKVEREGEDCAQGIELLTHYQSFLNNEVPNA